MDGTIFSPIQIDESYFSGRRKYNRGRMLEGDKKKQSYAEYYDWGEESPEPDEQEPCPVRGKNYGRRIVGPWVLGLYKSSSEVRFVVIPDRSGAALLKVIKKTYRAWKLNYYR